MGNEKKFNGSKQSLRVTSYVKILHCLRTMTSSHIMLAINLLVQSLKITFISNKILQNSNAISIKSNLSITIYLSVQVAYHFQNTPSNNIKSISHQSNNIKYCNSIASKVIALLNLWGEFNYVRDFRYQRAIHECVHCEITLAYVCHGESYSLHVYVYAWMEIFVCSADSWLFVFIVYFFVFSTINNICLHHGAT